MCDTVVVVRPGHGVFFAKNSDRDANEAQRLTFEPAADHARGARLRCTWLEIAQVEHTHAVLLARPFWMWGAEMGANEHGVVIGNEAVFTRRPLARTGLLGMDLVRLGLERGSSAREAVAVIVALLERHGQGGGCGYEDLGFAYHNSFLVADATEALVLETAGREWALETVSAGVRSISNGLTIEPFARRHADRLRGRVARCHTRAARTAALAGRASEPDHLMALLRDHGPQRRWPRYALLNGCMDAPCMHAGGLVAASQTVGSWVSQLRPGVAARHWVTASAAPCLSAFKPIALGPLPQALHAAPHGAYDPASLWWAFERVHRRAMRDPEHPAVAAGLRERDALEAAWLRDGTDPAQAFDAWREHVERWRVALTTAEGQRDRRPGFVQRFWAKREALSGSGP